MKLSVIVCTYNGASYLHEQIDSLLSQTLQPDEILIHDDGSSDATCAIAQSYGLRVIHNPGPHGVNGNFFNALHAASGDIIAICDQDDIWEPTKLEKQMALLQHSPESLLCGCISQPFSNDGTPITIDERPANLSPLRMMYVGMMPGHTLLLRRQLLDYVPRGNFFMYDLQLQMAAAMLGKVCYVPEVLVHQRRYPTATTYMAPQNRLQIFTSTIRTYFSLRPVVRERFRQWQLWLETSDRKALPTIADISRMVRLQQGKGPLNYLSLTIFCLCHRREILPTTAIRGLQSVAFALAFPLTCVNYYRYFLNKKS